MKEKVHDFYESIRRLLHYLWIKMKKVEDSRLKLFHYNLTLFIT
jgi:hypothetical protein